MIDLYFMQIQHGMCDSMNNSNPMRIPTFPQKKPYHLNHCCSSSSFTRDNGAI